MISQSFKGKTDQTEKWYGTEYRVSHISQETLQVASWLSQEMWTYMFFIALKPPLRDPNCVINLCAGSRALFIREIPIIFCICIPCVVLECSAEFWPNC